MTSLFDNDDEGLNDDNAEINHRENQSNTYDDYDGYEDDPDDF